MKKYLFMLVLSFNLAFSHSLWINNFESHSHQGYHVMTSIGWGHNLPMGDILNGENGKVNIKSFNLYDTNMNKYALYKPDFTPSKPSFKNTNFSIFKADVAMQKIHFNKNTKKGIYQLEVKTIPAYYTIYKDNKNRKRFKLKPKDEIEDLKLNLSSFRYQAFAKSFICAGKTWKKPKNLNHKLEIIPLTSLCDLHIGDVVEFFITFEGEPITTNPQNNNYATFWSNTYGQSDGFKLFSQIRDGKAKIRIPSSGGWIMNIYHTRQTTKDGNFKEFYSKANTLMNAATLSFTVK